MCRYVQEMKAPPTACSWPRMLLLCVLAAGVMTTARCQPAAAEAFVGPWMCGPGKGSSSCQACTRGTYSSGGLNAVCRNCSQGLTTAQTGLFTGPAACTSEQACAHLFESAMNKVAGRNPEPCLIIRLRRAHPLAVCACVTSHRDDLCTYKREHACASPPWEFACMHLDMVIAGAAGYSLPRPAYVPLPCCSLHPRLRPQLLTTGMLPVRTGQVVCWRGCFPTPQQAMVHAVPVRPHHPAGDQGDKLERLQA